MLAIEQLIILDEISPRGVTEIMAGVLQVFEGHFARLPILSFNH
jgi:hypothetical protein